MKFTIQFEDQDGILQGEPIEFETEALAIAKAYVEQWTRTDLGSAALGRCATVVDVTTGKAIYWNVGCLWVNPAYSRRAKQGE